MSKKSKPILYITKKVRWDFDEETVTDGKDLMWSLVPDDWDGTWDPVLATICMITEANINTVNIKYRVQVQTEDDWLDVGFYSNLKAAKTAIQKKLKLKTL